MKEENKNIGYYALQHIAHDMVLSDAGDIEIPKSTDPQMRLKKPERGIIDIIIKKLTTPLKELQLTTPEKLYLLIFIIENKLLLMVGKVYFKLGNLFK